MPQLDFTFYSASIFWLFVSFGLLYAAIAFWLLPPVVAVMRAREEKVKLILRDADRLNVEAEKIHKEYQLYMDDVENYNVKILQTAHDDISTDYAVQEEALLKNLKSQVQSAETVLDKQKENIFAHIGTITTAFMRIVLKRFYEIQLPAEDLERKVNVLIRKKNNG